MGVFHHATITPTKAEVITEWLPTQPWGPPTDAAIEVFGSYRLDDTEDRVGMECHLVRSNGTLFHVPLTYRDEPLEGAEAALITEMEHSKLGTRWVYDGFRDDRFVTMLAAVTMTGQGEALGMGNFEGRWYIAPANVRIEGGGWNLERVAVDGFELVSDDGTTVVFDNDRFRLTSHRKPHVGPRPAIGLTAIWDNQPDPVIVAEVTER